MTKSFNILSLDGGGVRGLISSTVLSRLSKEFPDLIKNTDMIIGTSTGGIMGMALASGVEPDELTKLYSNHGKRLFASRGWWDRVSLDEALRADYDNDGLKMITSTVFGKRQLKELGKNVIIVSYDLDAVKNERRMSKPKFFDSKDPEDGERLIKDVALATSAAPTYFPTYQGFIDGSIVANNPSDCGLVHVLKSGVPMTDIKLLSLGTGFQGNYIEDEVSSSGRIKDKDWGLTQWSSRIIQLFIQGSMMAAHYKCEALLGDSYIRVDPNIPDDMELDSIDMLDTMRSIGDNIYLDDTVEWLEGNWTNGYN